MSIKDNSTSATQIATGTTAERPGSPVNGQIRYNTTTGYGEIYNAAVAQWLQFGTSPSLNVEYLVVAGGGGSGYSTYHNGGGGAGAAGAAGSGSGGNGGAGVVNSISGSSVYYGGGGGGSGFGGSAGSGGIGGGGPGGTNSSNGAAGSANGTVNTGGGAGGYERADSRPGATGGSGIIILKYSSSYNAAFSGGLVVSSSSVGGYKTSIITSGTGTVTFSIA